MSQRITIFTGHYGSGKTSISAQYAKNLARAGERVAICDLDIVNPYFRTADRRAELEAEGIRVVASRFSGGTVDVPSLPGELGAVIRGGEERVVLDVGGDDRGALALGRYAGELLRMGEYENLFVVNFFRPRSQTPEDALLLLHEVEAASGLPVTALVHNSNLGLSTTAAHIRGAMERMDVLSQITKLPVAFTAVQAALGGEPELQAVQPLWLMQESPDRCWRNARAVV